MRLVASALGALLLVAGSTAPAGAQTQPKPPPTYAKKAPPPGASTVSFHGRPKPHDLYEGWVPQHWR